jgi:GNAT superfamily N-acetyltransferase
MVRDPITLPKFRNKILLDENFDPEGCTIVENEKKIIGFIYAISRRYPYYGIGLEEGTGWITVIFIHPEYRKRGIAAELLKRSEDFFKNRAVRQILISPYTPNYFIPGVDIDIYAEAHSLFTNMGFTRNEKAYSMGRSLLDFDFSKELDQKCKDLEKQNIQIVHFESKYTIALLEFLRKEYPGDLFRIALERLRANTECDSILVAVKNGEVIGFSHFDGDHFGPFGISSGFGGRNIGSCLYYKTALRMKERGERNLWLAWTSGHAKDFYHKMGLKVLRRHEILKKVI